MTTNAKEDTIHIVPSNEEGGESCLSLGAQVSLQAVFDAPDSPDLLRRNLACAVTWQQRNETTVENALRSPVLAPQWVAVLLALGAHAVLREEREKPLAAFLDRTKPYRDKLVAVHLPLNVAGRVWGASHVTRTPADEPIVGAVAVVDLTGNVVRQARLALTGVWREPVRLAQSAELLVGGPLNDDHIRQLAAAVEREVTSLGDFRGSAEYRRAMVAILSRRALNECRRGANVS